MQKNYQTLARRYRPQKFLDVVGQESVVTTLKNAIRLNRSSHAYLFSGSRGIGKTTLARLFAKALNCNNLSEDIEPCNGCQSCLEITSGSSLDVIEIDGASNRGIDDIRQINETISYAPSSGKYKIYIIDEVHMLTKEAFNALLKTLEEPPAPIKFFFATTEPHKVPPTILSRCQRFDLLRISQSQMIHKLADIAKELNRKVDPEALHTIALFSEGSLRDAESLLDQLFCFEEGVISIDIVNQTLGIIPSHYFFELDKAMMKEDISFSFTFVETIYHAGKDLSYFIEELITHFRHHLLAKMKQPLSQLPDTLQTQYFDLSKLYEQDQLLFILDYLLHAQQQLQKSPFKQVTVEMILQQIIRSKHRLLLPTLVDRLIQLENKLASSSLSLPSNAPSSSAAVSQPSSATTPFTPASSFSSLPQDNPQPSQEQKNQPSLATRTATNPPSLQPKQTTSNLPKLDVSNPYLSNPDSKTPIPANQKNLSTPHLASPLSSSTSSNPNLSHTAPSELKPSNTLSSHTKQSLPPSSFLNLSSIEPTFPSQNLTPTNANPIDLNSAASDPIDPDPIDPDPMDPDPMDPDPIDPDPADPIKNPHSTDLDPKGIPPVQDTILLSPTQKNPSSSEIPPILTQHIFDKTSIPSSSIPLPTPPAEMSSSLFSHTLQPVPFLQNTEEKQSTNETKKSSDPKHRSHYDTLIRFAAVELNGSLKMEP